MLMTATKQVDRTSFKEERTRKTSDTWPSLKGEELGPSNERTEPSV
jgi:hypothetical protein